MFLQVPADNEAASRLYKNDLDRQGFVMTSVATPVETCHLCHPAP